MNQLRARTRRALWIYQRLLRLYPRNYREEYGQLMMQFFRDQCRTADRSTSAWGFVALILRAARDLGFSTFREHLNEQSNNQNKMPIPRLSLSLFIVATFAGLLSCKFAINQSPMALGFAYLSAAALLLRAILEWKRPDGQWVRSVIWGVAIAIIYSVIFPVWGKVNLPVIPALVVVPMLLNTIVPLFKAALRLTRPRY